jgi:TonB family protein
MKVLSGALLLATLTLSPLPARSMSPQAAAPQATAEQKQQLLQLNQEVAKLANDGNYKDAFEKAKKVPPFAEKTFGKQSTEHAFALHNLANISAALGKISESEGYYKKIIGIYDALPRSEGRRIRVYKELAAIYRLDNNLLAARDSLQKAILLSEGLTKLLNNEGVDLLFDQAAVIEMLKRPKEAEPVWAHGLDLLNRINGGRLDVVQLPTDALWGRVKKAGYVKGQEDARGTVVVNLSVDETGKVTEATVVTGAEKINPIALRMARETMFNPLSFNGKPMKMTGTVIYRFNSGFMMITREIITVPL